MTDKPIIFSAPMIRALLDGRKNQHRFPMTTANTLFDGRPWRKLQTNLNWGWARAWVDNGPSPAGNPGPYLKLPSADDETVHRIYPETQPGDRLWVREAFNQFWFSQDGDDAWPSKRIIGAAEIREIEDEGSRVSPPQLVYGESDRAKEWFKVQPWRPPIHMPRWASRLTLTVTDVRVQRLQDISEGDAAAEGVEAIRSHNALWAKLTPENLFASLWNSLHGPNAWDANPWVCAITFDVTRGNIDAGAV